ncbi:glutaredoxin-C9-like [Andrographis paniculata]|uniref:glutaredoxin-C9-like n=1 Tax=Andrographis paniculata TaxID=175694 RepID=UPI0021E77D73|nr:glutaredoxin-C9-like [Andrographis paniculata]
MRKALELLAAAGEDGDQDGGIMRKVVAENAVVIFARNGCCMCHVVKLLLHGHGVSPTVVDVDELNEVKLAGELTEMIGGEEGPGSAAAMQFPAVFVGGELFGGLEEIMGAHISGELVPKLREARALWL